MRLIEFTEQGRDYSQRGLDVQRDTTGAEEPIDFPQPSRSSNATRSPQTRGSSSLDTSNDFDDVAAPIDTNAPPGSIRPNPSMNPIFSMRGASRMTRSNAARIMQSDTLPRARAMAGYFGNTLMINDAIAKAGTSRERNTPNSQHFRGTALDISISGMSNEDKIRLFRAAQQAGFTGFGFGNNILHVDTGPRRHWSYGNSNYGGVGVATLGQQIRSGTRTA